MIQISKLINQAKTLNVTYIRYYDHLVEQYDNPKRSQELLELEFRNHLVEKFKNAASLDSDSKLMCQPPIPREDRLCLWRRHPNIKTLSTILSTLGSSLAPVDLLN